MKYVLTTLFAFFLSVSLLLGQETKRVLFIGNSYTYVNNLPGILNSLANLNGDTVIHSSSTPGGAQLVQHAVNSTTMNAIRQGTWDFVVIQEQSQKPSFHPTQVASDVLLYAAQLNDTIEQYNSCAETVFYMTWGRKNGDAGNCASYPPVCTYAGMQDRLRSSYLLMAQQNNAICSPVGAAWAVARDSFPGIELYSADQSHPSYAGSYLAACTFYAALFRKSPIGLNFYGSLTAVDAQALQVIADRVVLDSLSDWYIGDYDVNADFLATMHVDSASFTNNSTSALAYIWDFGDNSALSVDANPSHIYDSSGTYAVVLIANDGCGNLDTTMQNLVISIPTALENVKSKERNEINCYPNPAKNSVTVTSEQGIKSIRILNSIGEEVFYQKDMNTDKNVLYLESYARGTYFISVETSNSVTKSKKLVLQ
jgi:hypothetical protein